MAGRRWKRNYENDGTFTGERSGNFSGGDMNKYSDEGSSGDDTDNWVASAVEATPRRHFAKEVRLLPNERMGWWSAQKFDRRVRMRTLANGAVNDSRTRILLDTGANVSVISERYAKILRFATSRTTAVAWRYKELQKERQQRVVGRP
ncbi:unnamed protein product [Phytophthora lilii]|uniref:Unnamed protein product n=1 Tax=Phytophthora lilii TaxID=2077276 RepID=A0A9W6U2G3_9STRA|nr:unnamed protein product [Phytophthora lilii]